MAWVPPPFRETLRRKDNACMASMTVEELEYVLKGSIKAPMIKYDKGNDSFVLMSIFFKALGKVGANTLVRLLKAALPGVRISRVWTSDAFEGSQSGYECVEFKV
jgi:hypothetical protein